MPNFLKDARRLSRAIELAHTKFEGVRKARVKFMMQAVGRFYGHLKDGSSEDRKATPVNALYKAITTYVPNLVFNNPRFKVRTGFIGYRPYADRLELAVNHVAKDQIDLRMTLRKCVMDAIFLAGFVKTGIGDAGKRLLVDGNELAVGEPFVDRVDPDDMILDPMARDWKEQYFVGNRYRVPREYLLESGLMEESKIRALGSRYDDSYKNEASSVSDGKDTPAAYKDVIEYVDLCDVFIPSEGVIVTLPWTGKGGTYDEYLNVVEYNGPRTGPYHMLGFAYMGDNLLPVPPAGLWYDLHVLGNRIARKLARQAERQKSVLVYDQNQADDAAKIAESDDGDTIGIEDVDSVKELSFGGVAEGAYEWQQWAESQFSEMAGNVEQLAGVKSDVATATQAEILQTNASVRLADAQQLVYDFAKLAGTDIAYYLHTDPLIELPLVKRVQGQDTQVMYTPEMREGEWFDYFMDTQPYSMARQDPNMKVRRVLEYAQSVIPAAAQAFQILGPAFKIEQFLIRIGNEIGIEDLDEIIDSQVLAQQMMQMIQQFAMGGMPPPPQALGMPKGAGIRPNQPNPMQMGPSNGTAPQAERHQQQQATGGELQQTYGR